MILLLSSKGFIHLFRKGVKEMAQGKKKFEEAYCHTVTNCAIHMLFLIESLLLKKAVPVVRPKLRAKNLHLIAEGFRPRGCRDALVAAKMLIHEEPGAREALEKLIESTLNRSTDQAGEIINSGNIEHLYNLLLIVAESGSYLCWDGRREFI